MRIYLSNFRRFRSLEDLSITPAKHVLLVGEPGAGRSDVIEGLERVLWSEGVRLRMPTDLDFFRGNTDQRAEVEVVLGDLGDEQEQRFFDHLELWDSESGKLTHELGDPELVDRSRYEPVVRLCYRIRWNEAEEQAEHWLDFPKTSDPDGGVIDRVSRIDRESLRFAGRASGRPFDLGRRAVFRHLVERAEGDDFGDALDALKNDVEEISATFSQSGRISAVLDQILEKARLPLGAGEGGGREMVRFLPEGGSIAGLIRSLAPALDLKNGSGLLPLERHGSTVTAVLETAQSLVAVGSQGIVVVDDFGEDLDGASCQFLAAALRRACGQLWLSTRKSSAIEAFSPEEVVRLARPRAGRPRVYYGRQPRTQQERLAARHYSLQLTRALTSKAVLVLEGPHDRAALSTLARRLYEEENLPPPSAFGITIVDSGAADGSGGSSGVPRLAKTARELGLYTAAILDHDGDDLQASRELSESLQAADIVIRLPPGHAIERAVLSGLPSDVIRSAIRDIAGTFAAAIPPALDELDEKDLVTAAIRFLKHRAGVHGQFIDALPRGTNPLLLRSILEAAVKAVVSQTSGLLQL